jgi:hypothetical protein
MTVTAYDVMGDVHLVLRVTEQDGKGAPLTCPCEILDTVRGSGEPDVREWARDALVALLEDL